MELRSLPSNSLPEFQLCCETHSHPPQAQPNHSGIPPTWPDLPLWLCLAGDLSWESSQL